MLATLHSANSLTIAGVPRYFLPDSLKIDESANGRNNLSLNIPSADGTYRPQIGDEVVVIENGVVVFGGVIEQPAEAGIGGEGRFPFVTTLTVPDYSTYADRRYVSGTIPAGSLKSQLAVLVPYLADHGVTLDPAQADGPDMTEIPCDFIQLSQLLDQMATITGFVWEVDYTKQLKMFSPGLTPAPFNITSGDGHCIGDVTVERSRQDYANRIILRFTNIASAAWGFLSPFGGQNVIDGDQVVLGSTTYTFKAVLDTTHGTVLLGGSWTDSMNNLIGCIVNGGDGFTSATGTAANSQADAWQTQPDQMKVVAKTPGAAGNNIAATTTSLNAHWYWEGNQDISALMGGADEALTGQVEANDQSQQMTYGMWEKIVSAQSVRDWDVATALVQSLLQQSLSTISTVKYETAETGLHPGQTQTITIPERGLSGIFTITDIEISLLETNPRRAVTLTGGSIVVKRWQDDAKIMLGGGGGGTSVSAFSTLGGSGGTTVVSGSDLEYLGDYAPTIYNDGDIVVTPDGIAYMCVKSGVDTPPEPWPGGPGAALNGSGTAGKIVKWQAAVTLTDSLLSESGSVLTLTGTFAVSTLQAAGGVIYSDGPALAITGIGSPRGGLAPFLRSQGTAAPTWTQVQYPDHAAADGALIMAKSGDWYDSSLRLPFSSPGNGGIIYDLGVNLWGQSTNFTFSGTSLALVGDMTLTGFIGSPSYASQTTGWRIDATGGADFRYLFVDEMHTKSFIVDLEQTLAGGQIIAKGVASVAAVFTAPALGASASLRIRDLPSAPNMAAFQPGDSVVVRTFSRGGGSLTIADCVGVVSAYADQPDGTQTWTLTRYTGANGGTMLPGTTVAIDSLALDYGTTGNGYYEVSAVDGTYGANSPYSQIVTWTTAPIGANEIIRARLGNLYGITGLSGEYGLIAGTYAGVNGQYFRASSAAFELHGIDLLLWEGATNTVKLSHTTPSFALGSPIPLAYMGSNPGVWMGRDTDGIYKFRVGNPAGSYAAWNGSTFTVVGAINATSGNIEGDLVVGTGGQIRSGATGFNSGIGWWLDYNAGSPRFRVGNPGGDHLQWDGSGLAVKSGLLTIDGSYGGRVGIGAFPYSIATLNVAALGEDNTTMSLYCTSASGTKTSLICYGDGSIFLGNLIHIIAGTWADSAANGWVNAGLQANGPFGTAQPAGWMKLYIDTTSGGSYTRAWIPIWLG